MNIKSMVAIGAGPSQLIAALCDELHLESIINECVTWHPSYWKASPGEHVKAMIINILCARTPLYRIEEFYRDLDVEMLFGPERAATDFNDDALSRTLDLIHEAESWKVYSSLSVAVLRKLGLPLHLLHNDTTSVSFYGAYPDSDDLNITYGYNKDGRPDLKQIVIGLGVTPQRLPLISTIENGNKDDKTWNHEFISKLRMILSEEDWAELTYVADSALATPDNLAELTAEPGISFITRLPDTYSLSQELKETAVQLGNWEDIGTLSDQIGSAHYRLQSFTRSLYGRDLRFVVVHSNHLAERQNETMRRQVEQERKAAEKLVESLAAERFACEHDASTAAADFLKTHKWKWHSTVLTTEAETYTLRRSKRGRPKTGETPEEGVRFKIVVSNLEELQDTISEKKHRQGMFVLMTNHADMSLWPSRKVLQTYKGQDAAETRFRLLKDPAVLDAVYVKTPSRIEALMTVFVMALLLYGVLEWRVRENLKHEKEPLILPGKRKSFVPTGEMLLILLKTVQVILLRMHDGQVIRTVSDHVDENVKRILLLAGYNLTIYTETTVEATRR